MKIELTVEQALLILVHALSFGVHLETDDDANNWQAIADKIQSALGNNR